MDETTASVVMFLASLGFVTLLVWVGYRAGGEK